MVDPVKVNDINIDATLAMAREKGFENSRKQLDAILTTQFGTGPLKASTHALLRGFNHRQTAVSYEWQRALFGYTFFTRPCFNMSVANCYMDRRLAHLVTKDKFNVVSWIRHMLDPELSATEGNPCPLVDDLNPWVPLYTNTIQSLSGWPSLNASIGSTAPSRYGDKTSFYDGNIKELKQTFNLSASFQNMAGKFGLMLFFYWMYIAHLQQQGFIYPHFLDLAESSKNYDMRIIRFEMDPFKRYITDWTAAGTAIIQSVPIGDNYSFESTGVFNTVHDQYTIPFECQHYAPADPRILKEFNDLTVKFNPKMADGTRSQYYQMIPPELLNAMNFDGYPWVDLRTKELQWWLPPEKYIEYRNTYERVKESLK